MTRIAIAHHGRHFEPWHRWSLTVTGTLLLLSGTVWLALHYLLGAGAGELPHPLEAWSLRLHGLAAYASLFVLGLVTAAHVPQGWRLVRRPRWSHQRRSGLLLCALCAGLALSGYLLYYFAPETVRPALGWGHALAGVTCAGVLVVHRRGRRQAT